MTENLRKFLESEDPAMVMRGLSMAKSLGVVSEYDYLLFTYITEAIPLGDSPFANDHKQDQGIYKEAYAQIGESLINFGEIDDFIILERKLVQDDEDQQLMTEAYTVALDVIVKISKNILKNHGEELYKIANEALNEFDIDESWHEDAEDLIDAITKFSRCNNSTDVANLIASIMYGDDHNICKECGKESEDLLVDICEECDGRDKTTFIYATEKKNKSKKKKKVKVEHDVPDPGDSGIEDLMSKLGEL